MIMFGHFLFILGLGHVHAKELDLRFEILSCSVRTISEGPGELARMYRFV